MRRTLPELSLTELATGDSTGLSDTVRVDDHTLILFREMEPMIRSLLADIASATRRVLIETYIIRDDVFGSLFADAMGRAAARGVEVRLLYDPLGCEKTPAEFFERVARLGVVTRAYRPRSVMLKTMSYGPRDHSRVLVVDDHAYTGGAAFGDEWLPKHLGGGGWHDVCVSVRGPCVDDFVAVYEQRWIEATGADESPDDICTFRKHGDIALAADSTVGDSKVYNLHREAIQASSRRVWLENAYFYPPPPMTRDLYGAAARGVDVRIILPFETDLPLVRRAARAEFSEWLRQGLRIFEYQGRVLHSKFALVDDAWSTVGTFNANPPGIGWSNEINLFVYDRTFVARVASLFESDLERCREVTQSDLDARSLITQAGDQLRSDLLTVADMVRGGSKNE